MISIRFNSDQMNDLLKSFSLYKLQGDIQIKGISYEPDTNLSQNPAEPKLDIDTTDAYLSMITELRGVTVKLTTVSGNYEGKILVIESSTNKIDQNNEYIREKSGLYRTQDKIMQILGDDITGLQITDQCQQRPRFLLKCNEVDESQRKQKLQYHIFRQTKIHSDDKVFTRISGLETLLSDEYQRTERRKA